VRGRRPARAALRHLGAAVAVAGVAACGADGNRPTGAVATPAPSAVSVFAAASLTEAFQRIGADFEAANPGTSVTVSAGASSTLAQQIVAGAPADVYAAASPATMRTVTDAGIATDPEVFARNRLQIAVPPENPGGVATLADLARPELTVALCDAQVPCGAAAVTAFAAAGLTPAPDTLERDVKAALAKVLLGEVDVALVYRTDVLAAGDEVRGVDFAESEQAGNDYLLAPLTSASDPGAARAFTTYVLSPQGQRVLRDAGFETP
jgi:molybdate transport system substrate-binding protein